MGSSPLRKPSCRPTRTWPSPRPALPFPAMTSRPRSTGGRSPRRSAQRARRPTACSSTLYERAVAGLPLPDYVGALGDVYARLGNAGATARQYALVDVERRLLIANGVRIDADLALFDTDHDHDLGRAVEVARVEYAV